MWRKVKTSQQYEPQYQKRRMCNVKNECVIECLNFVRGTTNLSTHLLWYRNSQCIAYSFNLFSFSIRTHARIHINFHNHFLSAIQSLKSLLTCALSKMHLRQSWLCAMNEKKKNHHHICRRSWTWRNKKTRASFYFCYFLYALCVHICVCVSAHIICVCTDEIFVPFIRNNNTF